ncbi:MAG: hypothetical protein J6574_08965, partial [Gilliamella sp.]|nr:hypothetical protein [Gilliamella sp.]
VQSSFSYLNPLWVNKENFLLLRCTILGGSYNDNLAKLTPWEHEAVDPYRHTGYDVINIVKDVDKW